MKKQRNNKKQIGSSMQINERLSIDMLEKLKLASKELKDAEIKKQDEAREKVRQEKVEKEKNKSFVELLDESNLDWKTFK